MAKDNRDRKDKGAKLEFVARITLGDGTVIEKVEASNPIPSPEDIDLHSVNGILSSFDKYEKAAVEARNKVCDGITEEYLKEAAKKKSRQGD